MERGFRGEVWFWLALILAGGLTLASKHSGIVFVASALGWVFVAALIRRNWRDLAATTLKLALTALLILSLWIALSPALWSDPPARLSDLLTTRAALLENQVSVEPGAPLSLAQRIEGIVAQPFLTPPQHYEAAFWGSFPAIAADVERYMASPFSGVQFGAILGGALTLLAGVGIIDALRRSLAQAGTLCRAADLAAGDGRQSARQPARLAALLSAADPGGNAAGTARSARAAEPHPSLCSEIRYSRAH